MTVHSSAPVREETPDASRSTGATSVISAFKRRAWSILNDPSIPPENRAILRCAMELNDPWLAKMEQMEANRQAARTST